MSIIISKLFLFLILANISHIIFRYIISYLHILNRYISILENHIIDNYLLISKFHYGITLFSPHFIILRYLGEQINKKVAFHQIHYTTNSSKCQYPNKCFFTFLFYTNKCSNYTLLSKLEHLFHYIHNTLKITNILCNFAQNLSFVQFRFVKTLFGCNRHNAVVSRLCEFKYYEYYVKYQHIVYINKLHNIGLPF